MFRRSIQILVVWCAAVAAIAVPTAANAAVVYPPPPGVDCPWSTLATGYGPVKQCLQTTGEFQARLGFFSPSTGVFNPISDVMTAVEFGVPSEIRCSANDAWCGYVEIVTGTAFASPYGGTAFGTQGVVYRNARWGRWGTVNTLTGLFYPSGEFYPCGSCPVPA